MQAIFIGLCFMFVTIVILDTMPAIISQSQQVTAFPVKEDQRFMWYVHPRTCKPGGAKSKI